MKSQKHRHHTFAPLNTAQIQAYRDLRESQTIAWLTHNRGRANELGQMLAELRQQNIAYKFID